LFYKTENSAHAISGVSPNPIDDSDNNSNTEIISINNSVRVRANYYTPGATWTVFGAPTTTGPQVGTSNLAGSAMETYQQGSSNNTAGSNCFSCHGTSASSLGLATTGEGKCD
jgi:hypothetical protein